MKRSTHWLVADAGIGEKDPDHCSHCGRAMGQEHLANCIIRERTVVMRFLVDLVVAVPETVTIAEVDAFYDTDGEWCGSALAGDVRKAVLRLSKSHRCLCGSVTAKFLREATQKDEEAQLLYVNQLPS